MEYKNEKDKIVNSKGREFVRLVGKIGGYILNGMDLEDRNGEFTFVYARGNTMIDYIVVNVNYMEIANSFT